MNEDKYVYVIEFTDSEKHKKTLALYDASNEEDCKKALKKYEGDKAILRKIKRMTEYDYKHLI